ncbi:MAG: HlyD family efflux transporter periplasmic adaptor subunit [Aureliella sp.]
MPFGHSPRPAQSVGYVLNPLACPLRDMTEVDLRELAIDRSGTGAPNVKARRRVLTRYVLPLVLILGFLSLIGWAAGDSLFPPRAVTVVPAFATTAKVRQEGTALFNAAGWVEPRPTPIRVAALAPGVVEKLLVVEDETVVAGQPVAELVKDDAKLKHDRALADLELRQAELEQANAAYVAAETRFKQPVHLEAELAEAEAALAKVNTLLKNLPFEIRRAQSDYDALKRDYDGKVSSEGVIAGIEIDVAKSKTESGRASVEELKDREESLKKELHALTERRDAQRTQLRLLADETKARDEAQALIKAAKARVEQARVAVAETRLELNRMSIVAPVDGRVFRLIAHPGARIGSGMTHMEGHDGSTVVTMYRPEMLQVRVDVRFEDIPQVTLKQPVRIDNPALDRPLTGEVLFISSEADIQKNTLQVKVAIPDPPPVFKPEMLVDVTFLSPKRAVETDKATAQVTRLFVPRQLIQNDGDQTYVWLADQSEGIARKQPIQTSTETSEMVEVTTGLLPSSRLISSGTDALTDGCRIRVSGEDPTIGIAQSSAP